MLWLKEMTPGFSTISACFAWQPPPMPAAPADDPASAYLAVATDLFAAGDHIGVESVLAEGLRRHPPTNAMLILRARAAEARHAMPEAAGFWQAARQANPGDTDTLVSYGLLLRRIGRLDEADEVLGAAAISAPTNSGIANEYAWCSEFRADYTEAVTRWERARQIAPSRPVPWRKLAELLAHKLGRLAEADTLLAEAVQRFPDDRDLALEHARLPGLAGDWPTALLRWTALAARHPDDPTIAATRSDAEHKVQMQAADSAGPGARAVELAVARSPWIVTLGDTGPDPANRDLMLRFESLGVSCEFGLVQRHFGAEPLGLLRWSSIHSENLAIALEQRFEGIEREADIEVVDLGAGEYTVLQNRYHIGMHSFIRVADTKLTPDQLRRQFGRPMRFLRDKLLEDIAEGEKILVYQYPHLLPDAEMDRLQSAVQAIGPAPLLFVYDVPTDIPVGGVTRVNPGRMIGHVDRLIRDGNWSNVSIQAWLSLCRNAITAR